MLWNRFMNYDYVWNIVFNIVLSLSAWSISISAESEKNGTGKISGAWVANNFYYSFDEKGIELITRILHDRVEELDECSIVISHRKESVKAATGDVVILEKKGGITTRVDFSNDLP